MIDININNHESFTDDEICVAICEEFQDIVFRHIYNSLIDWKIAGDVINNMYRQGWRITIEPSHAEHGDVYYDKIMFTNPDQGNWGDYIYSEKPCTPRLILVSALIAKKYEKTPTKKVNKNENQN